MFTFNAGQVSAGIQNSAIVSSSHRGALLHVWNQSVYVAGMGHGLFGADTAYLDKGFTQVFPKSPNLEGDTALGRDNSVSDWHHFGSYWTSGQEGNQHCEDDSVR